MSRMDIYATITDQIIAAIERGAGEWVMPWHSRGVNFTLPYNVVTGKNYQGANTLVLWIEQMNHNYSSAVWGTYKQWASLGATVRKGEKATYGIRWNSFEKKITNKKGDEEVKHGMVPFGFTVFNADQVEGWDYKLPSRLVFTDETEKHAAADAAVAKTGARIVYGADRACYVISQDFIMMPERAAFKATATSSATETFYATQFHELGHWTRHEKRLNRNFGKKAWGDEGYAMEELVAELTSAFLCGNFEISNEPRADHAQYMAHWLKVLKMDKTAIVTASTAAQKAADFIMKGK